MSNTDLLIAPCTYEAAKYAVEKWHYSGSMPVSKTVKYGAWENGIFIGAIIYSRGATFNIGSPYGLEQTQVCELTRMALNTHISPTSKILSATIRMFKKQQPGIRLIVSYADKDQGHIGTIYQATNWVYTGFWDGDSMPYMKIHGKTVHPRQVYSIYKTRSIEYVRGNIDPNAEFVRGIGKEKYLYPLDKQMRKQIAPLAKPYPKHDTILEINSAK